MSVTSTRRSFTPIWSRRFLNRSWVIGLGSCRRSSPAAIEFASRTPIQIGRVFRFSLSRRMTMGDWVTGSIVMPITCISLTMWSSFLAGERMVSGGPDFDAAQSRMPARYRGKVYGLVARGASAQTRGILRAFSLDQHFHRLPDACGQAVPGVPVLEGLEAMEPLACLLRGHAAGHICGTGPPPRGKPEGEGGIVPDFFHDRQRILEVFFRLPRESYDEIRGERDSGHCHPKVADLAEVFLPRVSAPHGGQDALGPRLDRQVDMGAKGIDLGEEADRLPVQVPRVRSEETDSPDSPDPGYPPKQFGERDLPFLFPVGVHVLPQKDNPPHDVGGGPADPAAPHMGEDAIGPEFAASLHAGPRGACRPARKIGKNLP